MSDPSSFIIDFTTTNDTDSANTNINVVPSLPSKFINMGDINKLIEYLENNTINIGNFPMITSSVNSIIDNIKSMNYNDADINNALTSLETASSDQGLLINTLKSLSVLINTKESSDVVLPKDDVKTGPSASLKSAGQKKETSFINTIQRNTLGIKVANMNIDITSFSNEFLLLINRLKASITPSTRSTSQTNNFQKIISNTTSLINVIPNRVNKTVNPNSTRNNNIFNNIAKNIFGVNNTSRTTSTTSKPINLDGYNAVGYVSSLSPSTITTIQQSYYYNVITSVLGGNIRVEYSYFPNTPDTISTSTSSTSNQYYTSEYYLSTSSLSYLCTNAYNAALKLSNADKQTLMVNSGLIPSSIPTNSDIWSSLLIWIFSFLSTGVYSQLVTPETSTFPRNLTSDLYNYMLDNDYLESVGNYGLTLSTESSNNSQISNLMSISIPRNWPSYMYTTRSEPTKKSYKLFEANSIINLINSKNSTSSS